MTILRSYVSVAPERGLQEGLQGVAGGILLFTFSKCIYFRLNSTIDYQK
jgi:hypothetical protein